MVVVFCAHTLQLFKVRRMDKSKVDHLQAALGLDGLSGDAAAKLAEVIV
jgi:hypothetical protein